MWTYTHVPNTRLCAWIQVSQPPLSISSVACLPQHTKYTHITFIQPLTLLTTNIRECLFPSAPPPPPLRLKTNLHHNHIGALKEASKGGPWSCCLCVWARACLQPGQQRAGEPREGKRVAGVLFLGSRGLVIHAMEMNDLIFPSYLFFVFFPFFFVSFL